MHIRNATADDIEEIMKIERNAFIPEIQENQETFLQRLKVFPQGFFLLYADKEGQPDLEKGAIGYYCSEIWLNHPKDESCFTLGHSISQYHNVNGKCLYISSVAVLKDEAGKGTGQKLFQECTEKILNLFQYIEESVLLVNEKWQNAMHIYTKFGFKMYKKLNLFFPDGNNGYTDGILMCASVKKITEACEKQKKE